MNARDTALAILSSHGYVSKNILSRSLNISSTEAGKILDNIPEFTGYKIFSRCLSNKIEISNAKLDGSVIYALSLHLDKEIMYKKEHELRSQFYETDDIVYPPAKSGIYYQDKREIYKGSGFLHSSTVKNQGKINDDKVLVIKNFNEKEKNIDVGLDFVVQEQGIEKAIDKCGIMRDHDFVEVKEAEERCRKEVEEKKENEERDGCLVKNKSAGGGIGNGARKVRQKKVNVGKADDGLEQKRDTRVRFQTNDENTPAQEIKPRRKGTPFPQNKVRNDKPKEINDKDKTKPKVNKATKKEKGIEEFYVPTIPVVVRKKIIKTRSFVENGKLMTEDYSSEEEIVINRTPMPIAKKIISQSRLNFN